MSSENESVNKDNVKNSKLHVNEEILEEGEVNHVSESSFMRENNSDHPKQPSINVLDPSSQDPFGIYKILNRNHVEKSPSVSLNLLSRTRKFGHSTMELR
ncbi:hypothetical protein Tco_0510254, partial [Tanacetum coccineum]